MIENMTYKMKLGERAAAVVELAVLMPLLILLTVMATDAMLAILARTQIENAARAAGEFAINNGYDQAGMTNAANNALTGSLIPLTTITVTFPRNAYCACPGSGSTAPISGLTGPACTTGTYCANSLVYPVAMTDIKVTGSYRPLFGSLWNILTNGLFRYETTTSVVTYQ